MMALVKFFVDKLVAFTLFILLLPLLGFIAFAIKLDSKGPVIYKQARVGKDRKQFLIYKFRSMYDKTEHQGMGLYTNDSDPRITKVGRVLRRWSLDELPQIINVLRGEMSLIGPRPTVKSQVDKYTDRQLKRLLVKPGITGLAQVKGRNNISWPERIELDLEYIENWSISMETGILIKTISVILRKEGIYD